MGITALPETATEEGSPPERTSVAGVPVLPSVPAPPFPPSLAALSLAALSSAAFSSAALSLDALSFSAFSLAAFSSSAFFRAALVLGAGFVLAYVEEVQDGGVVLAAERLLARFPHRGATDADDLQRVTRLSARCARWYPSSR
ncbi:hypothetical protein SRIMM317S_04817 [Streptomyces rimosus subsp. rimosus]